MSEVVSVDEVIKALKSALKKHKNIDVLTITANGEPTLYPYLDELVNKINEIKQNYKLLILSNGASIVQKSTRETLAKIDIVKLSLDCATKKCFKKIDRPHSSIDLDEIVKSMKLFADSFKGSLVVEVLVVKGINDKDEEFEKLNKILNEIKPDRVDISTIDRPPAYKVESVSMQRLKELADKIEALHVNIAYRKSYDVQKESFSEDEILNLISRRPLSEADITLSFDENSQRRFEKLLDENRVVETEVAGLKFFRVGERI
jgi:wyosine [tRNA(Phe)-imidazoG37] synthetase (radical SAM superfamily)